MFTEILTLHNCSDWPTRFYRDDSIFGHELTTEVKMTSFTIFLKSREPKSSPNLIFVASNDPETKRKKRIAAYNMFTREGEVKAFILCLITCLKNLFFK